MPRLIDIRRFTGSEKPDYWLQSELILAKSFFEAVCTGNPPGLDIFKDLLQSRGSIKSFKGLFTEQNRVVVKSLQLFNTPANKVTSQEKAQAFCEFLSRLNDPACRTWITAEPATWPDKAELTELAQITAETGFAAFSQAIPFATICKFVRVITNDRKGEYEYNHCRIGLVAFMRTYPDKLEKIIAIYERYPKWRFMSWKETLQGLYELMEIMGDDTLITDDDMNQAIFHFWTPQTPQEIAIKESFEKLPNSKRQDVYSRLRNSLSLADTRNFRSFLVEQLPASEKAERIQDRQRIFDTIALVENPFHPWHEISPTIGVEIEAGLPKSDVTMQPLLLSLGSINHFMGDGGTNAPLEVSPGPFRTGFTMNAIHQAWFDSGWLDLHSQKLQTLHQNVGLLDEQTVINLNGMVVSCAEVYQPVSTKQPVDFYRLLMLYNRADKGPYYMETKGYSVINFSDLKSHTSRYALLATAARCYELVHGAKSLDNSLIAGNVDVKPAERISPYMRQLEKIWVRTVKKMNIVYEYFGVNYLDSNEKPSLPQIDQILNVFPHIEDHYDAEHRLRVVKESRRTSFKKKYGANTVLPYQNLVQAARSITDQACVEIEAVMMQMQADFVKYLRLFANPQTKEQFWLSKEFNNRFPSYSHGISHKNLVARMAPLFKPFLKPGNTLPRPV